MTAVNCIITGGGISVGAVKLYYATLDSPPEGGANVRGSPAARVLSTRLVKAPSVCGAHLHKLLNVIFETVIDSRAERTKLRRDDPEETRRCIAAFQLAVRSAKFYPSY